VSKTAKQSSLPAESTQSRNERREAEIALAMQQEADRHAAAIKNMHRLRALRLSRADQAKAVNVDDAAPPARKIKVRRSSSSRRHGITSH
jgi:hypothetical protein